MANTMFRQVTGLLQESYETQSTMQPYKYKSVSEHYNQKVYTDIT